jgi:hypothetical protein
VERPRALLPSLIGGAAMTEDDLYIIKRHIAHYQIKRNIAHYQAMLTLSISDDKRSIVKMLLAEAKNVLVADLRKS